MSGVLGICTRYQICSYFLLDHSVSKKVYAGCVAYFVRNHCLTLNTYILSEVAQSFVSQLPYSYLHLHMQSIIRVRALYSRGGRGVSWSENCILTYDEVDTHIRVFFLRSALSISSIDFLSENDIFL